MNRPKESDFASQASYCRELEKYLYEVEAHAATDRHIAELANDTSARLLKDAQRYQWLRQTKGWAWSGKCLSTHSVGYLGYGFEDALDLAMKHQEAT